MIRLFRPSSIKAKILRGSAGLVAFLFMFGFVSEARAQQVQQGRGSIRSSVVVVNPSETKTQKVPVRSDLPTEITPADILNAGGLKVEFDTATSSYYLFGEDIELKPKEVKTFPIEFRDVWVIPLERIDALRGQTKASVEGLKGTEYYEMAQKLGETINKSLDAVITSQNDDAASTKTHIGIYRNNLRIIEQIKEDIGRLEKQIGLAGAAAAAASSGASSSPAAPAAESSASDKEAVKSDAPNRTATWMIVLIIMIFVGLLAGIFFVTWTAQAHVAKNALPNAQGAFPKGGSSPSGETKSK